MRRMRLFARRNIKEMLRDPLGCFFFAGFPVLMLLLFTIIQSNTPEKIPFFEIPSLLPGIIVFAYTFVMLYTALLVSKDKSTAFLIRLYASPMRPSNCIFGYAAPGLLIGILQTFICFATGNLILLCQKASLLSFHTMLSVTITSIPVLLLFVGLGIFFGSAFSEKAAPGVSSIVISLSGILSGAWMPLQTMGKLEQIASFLPFYPAVRMGRHFTEAAGTTFLRDLLVVLIYLVLVFVIAILAFRHTIKNDNR